MLPQTQHHRWSFLLIVLDKVVLKIKIESHDVLEVRDESSGKPTIACIFHHDWARVHMTNNRTVLVLQGDICAISAGLQSIIVRKSEEIGDFAWLHLTLTVCSPSSAGTVSRQLVRRTVVQGVASLQLYFLASSQVFCCSHIPRTTQQTLSPHLWCPLSAEVLLLKALGRV